MTPHQRGRADYRAGKHFTENPYKNLDKQHEWLKGWLFADYRNLEHEHKNPLTNQMNNAQERMMGTLRLKPLSKRKRRALAKKWLKQFKFYRDHLSPWKVGIGKELHDIYRQDEYEFKFVDVRWWLYIRRELARKHPYNTEGVRVDIDGVPVVDKSDD